YTVSVGFVRLPACEPFAYTRSYTVGTYTAGPSSFCWNPRTVVWPPANSRSCCGMNTAELENPKLDPSTAPNRSRAASTISVPTGMYTAPSTSTLLKCSDGSDPVYAPAVRNSNRATYPCVGFTGLSVPSFVTEKLATARRCRRCTDSRSADSQALNTAHRSAGCASVRPYSTEYENASVIRPAGRDSVTFPPTGVVRRNASNSERRSL